MRKGVPEKLMPINTPFLYICYKEYPILFGNRMVENRMNYS